MGTQKSREHLMMKLRLMLIKADEEMKENPDRKISQNKILAFLMEEGQISMRTAKEYLASLVIMGFIETNLGLITLRKNET